MGQSLAKALDHYQKAINTDPKNAEAWKLMGKLQEKQGSKKDARLAYKKSLEINPHQKDVRYRYNRLK